MADRIRSAKSTVLFAVMEPTGGGPVLASLRTIAAEPTVFSYSTVESDKGLAIQSPNGAMGDITGFAALEKNVPAPFQKEFSGGPGKHIHDKFVVVDFNVDNPTVFTGSSNLESGGETQNGDSLTMIEDEAVATMYAIEAIATFDHYHFRKVMQRASKPKPLTLWYPGKPDAPVPWWKEYYDRTKIQLRDRCLFAKVPLPPDVATIKTVDWNSVDAATAPEKRATAKKASTKDTIAKKGTTKKAKTKKAAAKKTTAKTRKKVSAKSAAKKHRRRQ